MRLEWGLGVKPYEIGVSNGVLYSSGPAVAWNGLVSVNEEAVASVGQTQYFDGNLVCVAIENDDYKATLGAFTYPEILDGVVQPQSRDQYERFGLTYRTEHGDDYQIHLVYGVLLTTSSKSWETISDGITPSLFSFDARTTALPLTEARPTAHLILDSRDLSFVARLIEDILYGTDTTDPRMPTAEEIIELYERATTLRITYHGDGSYTAEGEPELIHILSDGVFELVAPTVEIHASGVFKVSSYAR